MEHEPQREGGEGLVGRGPSAVETEQCNLGGEGGEERVCLVADDSGGHKTFQEIPSFFTAKIRGM